LFANAFFQARRHIITGVPWNRDTSEFHGMLVLTVAALLADLAPSIHFDTLDEIPNLHVSMIVKLFGYCRKWLVMGKPFPAPA
jgi:hypothetical protein